jgi:prepilin-type N-terminal cleavage/methylation domain-containing protein
MKKEKGFTLMELIVVIAITVVLSTVILFSVTQYISKGKDASISGNMAVLISAGEVYYSGGHQGSPNTYEGFCDPSINSALLNTINQMPENNSGACDVGINKAGLCCNVSPNGQSWAACAKKFSDETKYYCVDSRGVQKETSLNCSGSIQCP